MSAENGRTMLTAMTGQAQELWDALDALFAGMSAADWQRPHGPDWIFADLPFHLAYIDHMMVARPLLLGEELPAEERLELSSVNKLNAWNRAQFSKWPADQTVETSLQQMRSSRDEVGEALAVLTDADLQERLAWFPLLDSRGFRPAILPMRFCLAHTWGHLEEARVRLGAPPADIRPETIHAVLGDSVPVLTMPLSARKAQELDFTVAHEITGPGGGVWLFQAADGQWQINEGAVGDADLVLTYTPDGYIKTRYFIADLPSLLESGEVQANDMAALENFFQLFEPLDLDFEFPAQ